VRSRLTLRLLPIGIVTVAWTASWLYSWSTGGAYGGENILWTAVALVAAANAFVAARRPENRASALSFWLFGAGAVMWAFGQAGWTWYSMNGDAVPYPSWDDVGYLAAIPIFAAGIITWPRARRGRISAAEWFEMGLSCGALALLVHEFAIAPLLRGGIHGITGALDLTYPLAEFALAATVVVGLFFGAWRDRTRLVTIMLGLLALAVGDTMFVQLGGSVARAVEPAWTVPFVALGIAAALPPSARGSRIRNFSWMRLGLIMLAFTFLRGLQVVEGFKDIGTVETAEQAATSALLILVLARALAAGTKEREARERMEKLNAEVKRAYADRDAALEASRTGVALFSEGKARFWNHAFVDVLGLAGDGGEMSWDAFVARLDRPVEIGDDTTFLHGGRYIRLRVTPLEDGDVLATVDDVTVEESERENRDRFVAEIVQAREEEARSIAELLHDDALQELSALALRLELDALRSGNENLVDFARDTNSISRSIRRLVVDLHPAVLESRGLAPAIDMAAQPLRESGVVVEVDDLPLRLEPELERLCYRLAQEALANVLAHAHAERVDVMLDLRNGFLHCDVRDDGSGIEPERRNSALSHGRHGIHLARKRLELAGGALTVAPLPAGGTSFAFQLPVTARARQLEATA
jgi:signal transduction histidine kinase